MTWRPEDDGVPAERHRQSQPPAARLAFFEKRQISTATSSTNLNHRMSDAMLKRILPPPDLERTHAQGCRDPTARRSQGPAHERPAPMVQQRDWLRTLAPQPAPPRRSPRRSTVHVLLQPANKEPVNGEGGAPDNTKHDADPEKTGRPQPANDPNTQRHEAERAGDAPDGEERPMRPWRVPIPRPHSPECSGAAQRGQDACWSAVQQDWCIGLLHRAVAHRSGRQRQANH